MRVLGVDPGSRVCGYGVLMISGPQTVRYLECGVLTAPARAPIEARLAEVARGLEEVIAEFEPTVMAIESVFTYRNPRSALVLGQARGAALAVAGMAGLRVHSYAPQQVKKAVTGRGAASKQQVAKMVAGLAGLAMLPRADAADALAVALTHVYIGAAPIAKLMGVGR